MSLWFDFGSTSIWPQKPWTSLLYGLMNGPSFKTMIVLGLRCSARDRTLTLQGSLITCKKNVLGCCAIQILCFTLSAPPYQYPYLFFRFGRVNMTALDFTRSSSKWTSSSSTLLKIYKFIYIVIKLKFKV